MLRLVEGLNAGGGGPGGGSGSGNAAGYGAGQIAVVVKITEAILDATVCDKIVPGTKVTWTRSRTHMADGPSYCSSDS